MFQLYQTLASGNVGVLSKSEQLNIIKDIDIADKSIVENVYMLIYEHHKLVTGNDNEFPYESKINKSGDLEFDWNKFPEELKTIICKFIKISKNQALKNDT